MACDDLIDVTGRAAIQAVVPLSAGQAAGGPAQQGKRRAGVRIQTRRVTHWQNGNMVMRWLVLAFIRTEKRLNKIMAIAICGSWKLSSTTYNPPPAGLQHSIINPTAARHFQLCAGHALLVFGAGLFSLDVFLVRTWNAGIEK